MKEYSHFFNKIFRWQLFSTLYISLIQLVTIILLGRFLEYKELGAFALFQIVFRFAMYTLDPGMFFSIIQKHESSNKLTRILYKYQIQIILVSCILLSILWNFTNQISGIAWPLALNAILIITIIGFGAFAQSILVKTFRQKELVLAQMAGYTIELLVVLIFCRIYNPVLVFTSGILIRFAVFYLICYLAIVRNRISINLEHNVSEDTKSHIDLSKYNIASQIIGFIQGQYDTVIIIGMFGLSTLGGYILMTEISYMLFAKINPIFNKSILPVVSKSFKDGANTSYIIVESAVSYLYIILILYGLFWLYKDFIIHLAYPDKQSDLIYYAMFLIPIAFIKSLNNIMVSYIQSLGETKSIFIWNIVLMIFNYLVLIVLFILKVKLDTFLWISLIYTFLTFFALIKLFHNKLIQLKIGSIRWPLNSLYFIIFIVTVLGLTRFFIGHNVLALSLSMGLLLFGLYYFERDRLQNWFRFSVL